MVRLQYHFSKTEFRGLPVEAFLYLVYCKYIVRKRRTKGVYLYDERKEIVFTLRINRNDQYSSMYDRLCSYEQHRQ